MLTYRQPQDIGSQSLLLDLCVRAIAPLHVGVQSEQHWAIDVDYMLHEGYLYAVDTKKIQSADLINQWCHYLISEKTRPFHKEYNLKWHQLATQRQAVPGHAENLRRQIVNGLGGAPILPGSSLKGALRSVFFKALYDGKDFDRADQLDRDVLGAFDKSVMRHLQVPDMAFQHTAIYNTKVFNLKKSGSDWEGAWKHELSGGNKEKFSPEGFTTFYECLLPGNAATLRLKWLREKKLNNDKLFSPSDQANAEVFCKRLFDLIYQHTAAYLEAELAFWKSYAHDEHSETLVSEIKRLIGLNTKETPLLRVASGSGFHSITGNWQHPDDHEPLEEPKGRNTYYKSRRVAFELGKEQGYDFWHMGYLQFGKANKVAADWLEKAKQLATRWEEVAEEKAEAKSVKIWKQSDVRNGSLIDAEVLGQNGRQMMLRLSIEGYEEKEVGIYYPGGLPKGTRLKVTLLFNNKKRFNQDFRLENPTDIQKP